MVRRVVPILVWTGFVLVSGTLSGQNASEHLPRNYHELLRRNRTMMAVPRDAGAPIPLPPKLNQGSSPGRQPSLSHVFPGERTQYQQPGGYVPSHERYARSFHAGEGINGPILSSSRGHAIRGQPVVDRFENDQLIGEPIGGNHLVGDEIVGEYMEGSPVPEHPGFGAEHFYGAVYSGYGCDQLEGNCGGMFCRSDSTNACFPLSNCLSTCCCQPCPKWYVVGEAVFWSRNKRAAKQPLVVDPCANCNTLLSTDDLDFGNQVSPRFSIGRYVDCCCCEAWELSYFGINNWDASRTVTGAQLFAPGAIGLIPAAFSSATNFRVDYSSNLHNAEVNHVQSCCYFDLLAGFRYVSFDEDLNLNASGGPFGTGNYHVATQNDLYGGQIGARINGLLGCWPWQITGKAGIFLNDVDQSQSIVDPLFGTLRPVTTTSDTAAAFVGEVSCLTTIPLTKIWSLRAGYNLMWIENVALAPDQLDFTFTPTSGTMLNDNGGVFLHGANVGLQAAW